MKTSSVIRDHSSIQKQSEPTSKKAVVLTGAATGAILGAIAGSAIGPIGTLAGAVAGAVVGVFAALAMLASDALFGLLTDRQITNETGSPQVVEEKTKETGSPQVVEEKTKETGSSQVVEEKTKETGSPQEEKTKETDSLQVVEEKTKETGSPQVVEEKTKETDSLQVVEEKTADPQNRLAAENILQRLTFMNDELLSQKGVGRVGSSSQEIIDRATENAELNSFSAIQLVATLKSLFNKDGLDIMSDSFNFHVYLGIQKLIDEGKTEEAIAEIKKHLNEKDSDLSGQFFRLLNKISTLNPDNNNAANLNLGGLLPILTKKIDDLSQIMTISKDVPTRSIQMGGTKADESKKAAVGTFMIEHANEIFPNAPQEHNVK